MVAAASPSLQGLGDLGVEEPAGAGNRCASHNLPVCPPLPPQGLGDLDVEKRQVEGELQELAEAAAKDLGLVLDKTLK